MEALVIPETFDSLASHDTHVALDSWHMDALTTQLTLRVTSTQALVHCPVCQFPTRRVHSRYGRTLTDLPWGPWRVMLHLQGGFHGFLISAWHWAGRPIGGLASDSASP